MSILHLTAGEALAEAIALSGLPGAVRAFTDPLCLGPLPEDRATFLLRRRSFLIGWLDREPVAVAEQLSLEADLRDLLSAHERILLWLGPGLHDHLVMVRIIAEAGDTSRLAVVSLPPAARLASRFPGHAAEAGGAPPPAALAALAAEAEPIADAAADLALSAWNAWRALSPLPLWSIQAQLRRQPPPPPWGLLPAAITRYLLEYPDEATGLSLTERRLLSLVADGVGDVAMLAQRLARAEIAPWHPDGMVSALVRGLVAADLPALRWQGADPPDQGPRLDLTGLGWSLTTGATDWFAANSLDRWLGGVHLSGAVPAWRLRERQGDLSLVTT